MTRELVDGAADDPSPPVRLRGRTASGPNRPGGPTQDELLDEALKETFPASDPTSPYRLD